MTGPVVEVAGLSLSFRGMPVLEGIDLTLQAGEFVGLIGPNGGGKSMLLKTILGLVTPDRGRIRVLGLSPRAARGRIGYVPQYARFDFSFPIQVRDVALMGRLGRRLFGRYRKEDRERAMVALERVGMADLAGRQIGRLSGGQLQRVLVARALAVDAPILFLDEPTANLDVSRAGHLYELLGQLADDGVAVVLVSHELGVISSHVKSIACVNRRLHFHHAREITREMIEETYGCPMDFVVHGHTHRVLEEHEGDRA